MIKVVEYCSVVFFGLWCPRDINRLGWCHGRSGSIDPRPAKNPSDFIILVFRTGQIVEQYLIWAYKKLIEYGFKGRLIPPFSCSRSDNLSQAQGSLPPGLTEQSSDCEIEKIRSIFAASPWRREGVTLPIPLSALLQWICHEPFFLDDLRAAGNGISYRCRCITPR